MIITLTLNPAVDQTVHVERLEPGCVNRVHETQIDPAGKGINVSRMAHRLGWPTIAFGILAGETGTIVEKALEWERVHHHFVRVEGQTRVNATVVDPVGTSTSFFGDGPPVAPDALASLDEVLRFWLQAGRVLVLAGSLPPGVPPDIYATYVRVGQQHGATVLLDADGVAFRHGVVARPDLIKPNVAEAERLLGRALPDLAAVVEGARDLARTACGVVVISMGAEGAVCAEGERVWRATPPPVERRSTVGSGDAMVAGLAVAIARGDGVREGLRLGTAAGAATAMTPGTALGSAQDVARLLSAVQIDQVA